MELSGKSIPGSQVGWRDKMSRHTSRVQVSLAPNGFSPRSFRWQGRVVRVLSVESVRTLGAERRYLVRTVCGSFELGLYADASIWLVRRSPSWLDRVWAEWRNAPRYPLPVWRRRARGSEMTNSCISAPTMTGGDHADWLALVRQ
jgi:hypothetical protein